MNTIAFIGSRNLDLVPEAGRSLFEHVAEWAAREGLVLVTGAAPGADQLAALTALNAGGRVGLYLPWGSFERKFVESATILWGARVQTVSEDGRWEKESIALHPNPEALTHGARLLHARNYGIVEASDLVIALPRPPEEGGTAQGIRIARHLGKPCFNFSLANGRRDWMLFLCGSMVSNPS